MFHLNCLRVLRGLSCATILAAGALIASQASAGTIYAIDDQDNLFTFDSLAPKDILSGVFVTGLKPNEHLTNIDFRPSNNTLYGIGSTDQVYTINQASGVATPIGAGFGAVQGNSFGMDFNPAADRIRFYSDTDNNIRINPDTGLLAGTDTNLAYAPGDLNAGKNPNVVGAAYTNSVAPAPATTTLYGIDSNLDTLVRVGSVDGSPVSPNSGQLTTIGSLGVDTNNFVGLDLTANNIAFAALQLTNSSASHLYSIDLTTGHATDQGQIIGGVRVVDITTQPNVNFILPEPGSLLAIGSFALLAGVRRRRLA